MKEPVFSYVPGTSLLHRLDPRTKLAAVMLLGVLTFRAESFTGIGALFVLFFTLALLSGVPLKVFARAVRPMVLFITFIFLAQLFFTEGEALASFGALQPSLEGLENGTRIASRFVLLLLFAAVLTASTNPSAITAGIERMLRPLPLRWLGVTSFELATMMNLSIAFLPLLFERVERTKAAQAARGMDFGKSPFRSIPALAVPLLRGLVRDAGELALAMESRGYQGRARTSMHELSMKGRDWAALLVLLLFSILVLGL
ncbi:energy-coupling factor transporter transmembrane protein EcfT [Methanosarcina sp. KYL-1]|uniref:energy-coupling factor transporter transmembrane component T family protein n=1 Tax=Methanosarcina sp. KYL-1 TaxID=2602068 RepID=UPI0021015D64|nr:energy-coupling factor transporter transmembrane protein EcfT [Methanosarcina sp. KYL-1]MCQ1534112.1 energy-coupling factor transporter transmembrane protein EcfT [Methanosarcina sp. KYL-1]